MGVEGASLPQPTKKSNEKKKIKCQMLLKYAEDADQQLAQLREQQTSLQAKYDEYMASKQVKGR